MNGDIYIDDFLLPDTDGSLVLNEGVIDFEVSERTINNTLVSDFIGFKKRFRITWNNLISGELLEILKTIYYAKEDVDLKITSELGVDTTYVCKMNMSPEYLRESKGSVFAYSGVEISFEEV